MRRVVLILGLIVGLFLSTTVRAAPPAWDALTESERVIVDAVAADLWAEAGGRVPYAVIGEAERMALREAAIERLGTDRTALSRRWV